MTRIQKRAKKPPSEASLRFELQREIKAGFTVKRPKLAKYARMVIGERSPLIGDYAADLILQKRRKRGRPQEYWVIRQRELLARVVWYQHAGLRAKGEPDPYNAAIEMIAEKCGIRVGTLKRWYDKYRPREKIEEIMEQLKRGSPDGL